MTPIREYRFEACWLILIVLTLVLFAPSRPSAQGLSWGDLAFDCDSWSGWCGGLDDPGSLVRQLVQH